MYVKIIRNMYNEASTSVNISYRETKGFTVKFHQESASNPYLFSLVKSDGLTKGVPDATL